MEADRLKRLPHLREMALNGFDEPSEHPRGNESFPHRVDIRKIFQRRRPSDLHLYIFRVLVQHITNARYHAK